MFKHVFIAAIKVYKCVSTLFSFQCCRFYPTCSQYAMDAIAQYGVIKGLGKAAIRILRCSPASKGGFDPVR